MHNKEDCISWLAADASIIWQRHCFAHVKWNSISRLTHSAINRSLASTVTISRIVDFPTMEAIGLASSIIQLVQVVTKGLELARTLYKAPEEFAALQQELDSFHTVMTEVSKLSGDIPNGIIHAPLTHAHLTISQLRSLFDDTLLRKSKSSVTVRRRAWAKNKNKIRRLREAVKERSNSLIIALSAIGA